MRLGQGLAAGLLDSAQLVSSGLSPLFNELSRLGVWCYEPKSNNLVEPSQYYHDNPSKGFYILAPQEFEVIMTMNRTKGRLFLNASLDNVNDETNQSIIAAVNDLIEKLFVALDFVFAYIDLWGDIPLLLTDDVDKMKLQWLFWTNYFGTRYVRDLGKDFLLHAPGWSSEELSNGAIKYTISPNPLSKLDPNIKLAIVKYFEQVGKPHIYSSEQSG